MTMGHPANLDARVRRGSRQLCGESDEAELAAFRKVPGRARLVPPCSTVLLGCALGRLGRDGLFDGLHEGIRLFFRQQWPHLVEDLLLISMRATAAHGT